MITYHKYAGAELEKVFRYMLALGEPLPNPLLTIAFTAEQGGMIVAMSVLQNIPFIEPFHAESGHGETLKVLYEMTKEFLIQSGAPRMVCHTSHPAMKRMLERDGAIPANDQYYEWFRTAETARKVG